MPANPIMRTIRFSTAWRRRTAAVWLTAFFGLVSAGLSSAAKAETLPPPDTVRLAGDSQWEPFYGPNLPQDGVLIALIKAALATQDIEITADFLPWSRAVEETRRGRYDAIPGMYFTPERARQFRFSKPILPVETVLISIKGTVPARYETLSDLAGYVFSVLKNNAISPAFENADLRKVETPHQANQVRAIVMGSADIAAVSSRRVFFEAAERMGYRRQRFQVLTPILKHNNAYLATPRTHANSEALIAVFNAGLEQIRATGRFQQILDAYDMRPARRERQKQPDILNPPGPPVRRSPGNPAPAARPNPERSDRRSPIPRPAPAARPPPASQAPATWPSPAPPSIRPG